MCLCKNETNVLLSGSDKWKRVMVRALSLRMLFYYTNINIKKQRTPTGQMTPPGCGYFNNKWIVSLTWHWHPLWHPLCSSVCFGRKEYSDVSSDGANVSFWIILLNNKDSIFSQCLFLHGEVIGGQMTHARITWRSSLVVILKCA